MEYHDIEQTHTSGIGGLQVGVREGVVAVRGMDEEEKTQGEKINGTGETNETAIH